MHGGWSEELGEDEIGRVARAVLTAAADVGIGVAVFEPEGQGATRLYLNPLAETLLGVPVEQYATRDLFAAVTASEVERARGAWERLLREPGKSQRLESIVRHAHGEMVPIEVTLIGPFAVGRRSLAACFFVDLSERKRAEDALRHSEARFRNVVEAAPDGVSILQGDCFIYANPALVTMLGYDTMDEIVGRPLPAFVHPEEVAVLRERVRAIVAGHGILAPREYRLVRRDGSVIKVDVNSIPIVVDGAPAVLSFGRDVTDQRRIEAELEEAARLAAVGALAASVAHEINNPLAYLMLGLETLARDVPRLATDPGRLSDVMERLDEVRHGAERVRNIVRDLRTFSRSPQDEYGPVDVGRAIKAALAMTSNEIHHRAHMTLDLPELPPVRASQPRLEQVFVNLLMNAAQAVPDGVIGHIVVRGRSDDAGHVLVDVSDDGPGIAPEHGARLFEPFFTTKAPGMGTGLGLSICHRIVVGMGGQLTFRSEPGRGTTFRVALPVAEGALGPQAAAPAPVAAAAPRRRVLVVDDEPLVVGMLSATLGAEGHDVVSASGARRALDILTADQRFDLILCDLMMPDVTGMDLFEEVRRKHPALERRFAFMTGGAFTPRAAKFLAETGNPTIEKPFDMAILQRLLDRAPA